MELREEDMEILLWRYIDGQCTPDEQVHIQHLLATNTVWEATYNELLSFNSAVVNNIETDQPSMRFTQNVMDTVYKETPVHKTYTSKSFIKIFVGAFSTILLLLLGYAFATINWASEQTSVHIFQKLKSVDQGKMLFIVFAVNTILALVLIDTILKRKKTGNSRL